MAIRDYVPAAIELRPSSTIDTQFGFIDLSTSTDNVLINSYGDMIRCKYKQHPFFHPNIILTYVHNSSAFYSVTHKQWVKNRTGLPVESINSSLQQFIEQGPIVKPLDVLVMHLTPAIQHIRC